MAKSMTLNVRGFKVRTASHFRFQIVSVRTEPETYTNWRDEEITIPAGARIVGRTDNLTSAHKRVSQMRSSKFSLVIIDTTTGEEV